MAKKGTHGSRRCPNRTALAVEHDTQNLDIPKANYDQAGSSDSTLQVRRRERGPARNWRGRYDRERGSRTWKAKRAYLVLSRTRVHRRRPAEGKDRDRPA